MKQNTSECQFCGEPFVSKRNDARYCCNSHRQLAYYLRDRNRYSKGKNLNDEELISTDRFRAERKQLDKLSKAIDNLTSQTNIKQQKKDEEIGTFYVEMIASLVNYSRNNKISNLKNDTIKIVESLFDMESAGKAPGYKIKWLLRDIDSLCNSTNFEKSQTRFLQEVLLPHLQELSRTLRRSGERYIEYEIPPHLKRELQKFHGES